MMNRHIQRGSSLVEVDGMPIGIVHDVGDVYVFRALSRKAMLLDWHEFPTFNAAKATAEDLLDGRHSSVRRVRRDDE